MFSSVNENINALKKYIFQKSKKHGLKFGPKKRKENGPKKKNNMD